MTMKTRSLRDALTEHLKPATATHAVYLDGAAWAEGVKLREQIRATRLTSTGLQSDAPKLQAALDQVQARIKESELTFTFVMLPRTEYHRVLDDCQSDDPTLAWNTETFPPALIAAACSKVEGVFEADNLDLEDVVALYEQLGNQQTEDLFRVAFGLQVESPKPFMLAASATMPDSGLSLTTASSMESPTPGS